MNKAIAKILVVAVACGVLATALHWLMMVNDLDAGMSTGCATVCLTQGDSAPAIAPIAGAAFVVVIFFFLAAVAIIAPWSDRRFSFETFFQKDRHRYLMKTMVMRR